MHCVTVLSSVVRRGAARSYGTGCCTVSDVNQPLQAYKHTPHRLKVHWFDLMWTCCRHFDLLYNKSTTNRMNGIRAIVTFDFAAAVELSASSLSASRCEIRTKIVVRARSFVDCDIR